MERSKKSEKINRNRNIMLSEIVRDNDIRRSRMRKIKIMRNMLKGR